MLKGTVVPCSMFPASGYMLGCRAMRLLSFHGAPRMAMCLPVFCDVPCIYKSPGHCPGLLYMLPFRGTLSVYTDVLYSLTTGIFSTRR